ncbi:class I SAM-dependent methyltransferase [Polaribacter haliotis]|uniref:class I SAM-dependent methyltransferase n=1 Tax=Polaribacter haliotis TaxID=1888915 RepID=UPI001E40C467|nr:class I SAM-dependent methyltransferase [Polaribacter haliotis]
MKAEFESKYHDLESKHWWFKSRRNYIISLLRNESKDATILDVGCSSGNLLFDLEEIGFKKENLYGVDISEKAIENCKKRNLNNSFVMDAQDISLNNKFDIIIASDCLEHLKDDEKAIKNWNSLLKDNGKLIVFVPAYNWLWSNHDEVNMHYRRYINKDLKNLLENNNLKIIKKSYWNFTLLPAVAIYRFLSNNIGSKKESTGDISKINPVINTSLLSLLTLENRFFKIH